MERPSIIVQKEAGGHVRQGITLISTLHGLIGSIRRAPAPLVGRARAGVRHGWRSACGRRRSVWLSRGGRGAVLARQGARARLRNSKGLFGGADRRRHRVAISSEDNGGLDGRCGAACEDGGAGGLHDKCLAVGDDSCRRSVACCGKTARVGGDVGHYGY